MNGLISARLDPGWRAHADPAWLVGWQPRTLALAGGETEVIVMGDGPTVVLVPPLPGYKEAFAPSACRLAERFRVVTYDQRVRFAPGPRMPQAVADLERVLDAHGDGRVLLVGHSLGGAIAQRFALTHPGRVRGLVLSSTFAKVFTPAEGLYARMIEQPLVVGALRLLPDALGAPFAQQCAALERWVFDWRCVGPVADLTRFVIRNMSLADVGEQIRLALEHDARRELDALRMPTLVMWGARDTAFARTGGELIAERVPGARRALSPHAGHMHPMSDPAWFAAAIREFGPDADVIA